MKTGAATARGGGGAAATSSAATSISMPPPTAAGRGPFPKRPLFSGLACRALPPRPPPPSTWKAKSWGYRCTVAMWLSRPCALLKERPHPGATQAKSFSPRATRAAKYASWRSSTCCSSSAGVARARPQAAHSASCAAAWCSCMAQALAKAAVQRSQTWRLGASAAGAAGAPKSVDLEATFRAALPEKNKGSSGLSRRFCGGGTAIAMRLITNVCRGWG
mmetsp:Transcript_16551/g.50814  ORF Transcript_16551/g.50814 Transcript_16551/m.50814 type:complete len:219 (-) Transcript_16551:55-711(-)